MPTGLFHSAFSSLFLRDIAIRTIQIAVKAIAAVTSTQMMTILVTLKGGFEEESWAFKAGMEEFVLLPIKWNRLRNIPLLWFIM